MRTIRAVCWIFLVAVRLHAQEDGTNSVAKALAHNPLLQLRAAEYASWLIDGSIPAEGSPSPAKAKPLNSAGVKVNVVKTGNIMVQSTVDLNGQVWSTWCVGGSEVTVYPNKTDIVVMDGTTDNVSSPFYTDYTKTDFPEFAWLSASNCGGRKTFNGHKCLVFFAKRDPVTGFINPTTIRLVDGVPVGVPSVTEQGVISAYVDEETRLPVGIQEGKGARVYSFLAPPQTMLTLPDLVQTTLKERENKAKAAMRRIPH